MKLKVERRWKKDTYTIGVLSIDGVRFCETLEDCDRGLKASDTLAYIQAHKVPGETAIPAGTYVVDMRTVSPKYSAVKFYQDVCGGRVPRLVNVPGFSGILIHTGNTPLDTHGCILVGRNKAKGQVLQSRDTFKALYRRMAKAHADGERITIEIA